MTDQPPVLSVGHLTKAYGAVRALHDVSFDLMAGEILGLVGDNGAGKTTLVRCIAGIYQPDSGEILVDGTLRVGLTAESARTIGIETVHQNLSLVEMLDVAQNFFLDREIIRQNVLGRTLGWLDKPAMYRKAEEVLATLELDINPRRSVATLSGGQRQMVAVARAVAWGRHIVLMDEPAAALGVKQSLRVLEFVRLLSSRGIAVMLISHNMQHVLNVTHRIVVLRHGEKVGDLATRSTSAREIVELITGSDLVVPGNEMAV
jgi:ABC-type sugar transport system ATPase subunit